MRTSSIGFATIVVVEAGFKSRATVESLEMESSVSQALALRIGDVAAEAGVATSTIRYYERIGLLAKAARVSGQRRYDRSVIERLSLIEIGQRAGLSLDEIRELLDAGSEPISANLHELAERKLPAIDALIERATAMRAWLLKAQTCDCDTVHECGLFEESTVSAIPDGRSLSRPGT
jgi:MerR family redox-sensitive transcriptional activator SoxR